MGGRHCYASCVLLPVFDPIEFAKTGTIQQISESVSQLSTPGSRRSSLSPAKGSGKSPKKSSFARRVSLGRSSTPPPSAVEEKSLKTPERPRKVGEVYFIYDELKTLLLSVPFKRLDSGVVLLAIPIHRIGALY